MGVAGDDHGISDMARRTSQIRRMEELEEAEQDDEGSEDTRVIGDISESTGEFSVRRAVERETY